MIPENIMPRLMSDGITARFLAERLGVGVKEAQRILQASGCQSGYGGKWRMANATRREYK